MKPVRDYLAQSALWLAETYGLWVCNHFHKSWMWSGGAQKHCRKCGRSQSVKWFEADKPGEHHA